MSRKAVAPSFNSMLRFFLPLSATNLMLVLSHSIVNAGVARTAQPDIALASYALARSLVRMIENPVFMVRQTVVSLVKDRPSYSRVMNYFLVMAAGVTAVIAVLAWTPLGYGVFHRILGADQNVAVQSHQALRILVFLPAAAVVRNVYHGAAILSRATIIVPKSTLLRLIVMSAVIFTLALYTELPGAVSASVAFVTAFWVEALLMRHRAGPLLSRSSVFPNETSAPLTAAFISRFFLPLALTTLAATAFNPMIQAGLARSVAPVTALAAYAVGFTLSQVFCAPLSMLHQCTLAFTRAGEQHTYRQTKHFCIVFAAAASTALALLSFSGLADLLLGTLMGLSGTTLRSAQAVMQVMALMPWMLAWREYLWGIFMQQHLTGFIGRAKLVNLLVLLGVLWVLLAARWGNPAAAGAWAMVIGEGAECIYMQVLFRRSGVYGLLKKPKTS